MANIDAEYSKFVIHNMAVKSLREDGALCNESSKEYDIQGTAEGGAGGRKAFKNLNDKIKKYHTILEFLEGEKRANVDEFIPVIDFVHKENTGFLSKYFEDESGLYPQIIEDIPLDVRKSDLDLLKENDRFVINRALAGLTMAEHFYNASGTEVSSYDVQTSFPDLGNPGYIYRGSKSFMDPDKLNSSSYYSPLLIWKIDTHTEIQFSNNSSMLEVKSEDFNNPEYVKLYKDTGEYVMYFPLDKSGTIKSFLINPLVMDNPFGSTKTVHQFLNSNYETFIKKSNAVSANYNSLVLNSGDLLLLISEANYTSDSNKIIVIKKDQDDLLSCYVLLFDDARGFPSTNMCKEISYGEPLPFDELNIEAKERTKIAEFLNPLVNLDKVYYSKSSGLLNGYFCEPVEYRETPQGRTVSKWMYKLPQNVKNSEDYIGRLYNGGHLLTRGDIIDEPLGLTEHDSVIADLNGEPYPYQGKSALKSLGYKGKAQVFYNNLFNKDSVFIKAFYSDKNPAFTDWKNSNTPTLALKKLVTFTDVERNNSSYKYKDKIKKGVSFDAIREYVDNFYNSLNTPGHSGEVVLMEGSNYVSSYERIQQRRLMLDWLIGHKDTGERGDYGRDYVESYFPLIYYLDFVFEKKRRKIENPKLNVLSPYEAFLPSDDNSQPTLVYHEETEPGADDDYYEEEWPANPILIYPEVETKYPLNMVLMARQDILQEGSLVSFWNENEQRYLMLEVGKRVPCIFSNAKKIRYIGNELTYGELNETAAYSERTYTIKRDKVGTFIKKTYVVEKGIFFDYSSYGNSLDDFITVKYTPVGKLTYFTDELPTGSPGVGDIFSSNDGLSPQNFVEGEDYSAKYHFIVEKMYEDEESPRMLSEGTLYKREENVDIKKGDKFYYKNGSQCSSTDTYDSYDIITKVKEDKGKYNYDHYSYQERPTDCIDSIDTWTETVPDVEYRIVDKKHDCYVYFLTPKSISFEHLDSEFRDQNDKVINLAKYAKHQFMIPTVNNQDYFTVTPRVEDPGYDLNSSKAQFYINALRNSCIIRGLPNVTTSAEGSLNFGALRLQQSGMEDGALKSFYGAFLDSFNNESTKTFFHNMLSTLYQSLLKDFRISNSQTNPIVFGEVKNIVNNMNNLIPILRDALKAGMPVRTAEGVKTLTIDDIKPLEDRSTRVNEYGRDYYVLTRDFDEEYEDTDDIVWKYVEATLENGKVPEKHLLYYTRREDEDGHYHYSKMNPQPEPGSVPSTTPYVKSLRDTLYNVLAQERAPLLKIESKEADKDCKWYSFQDMAFLLDKFETNPDEECAIALDRCFGSGTYPFIRTSTDGDIKNQAITVLMNDYSKALNDIIYIVGNAMIEESDDVYLNTLKGNYKKYYTDSSVDNSISDSGVITRKNLKLKFGTKARPNENMTKVIEDILNNKDKTESNTPQQMVGSLIDSKSKIPEILDRFKLYDDSTGGLATVLYAFQQLLYMNIEAVVWEDTLKETRELFEKNSTATLTESSIEEYIEENTVTPSMDNSGMLNIGFKIPELDGNLKLVAPSENDLLYKEKYLSSPVDINRTTLEAMVDYIKMSLSGVIGSEESPSYSQGIRYSMGETNIEHPESLYDSRYKILNSRMNKINGPLYKAAFQLTSNSYFKDYERVANQTIDSYSMFADVLPIADIDSMSYLATQPATTTTVPMKGKFYSDKEMESLKNVINSQCILTCTKCAVKKDCPFYDQNEVVHMACTPMETIDIYLKDNELELIDEDSIEVVSVPEGGSFDLDDLKLTHKEYSEILAKKSEESYDRYGELSIDLLNQELIKATGLCYNDYVNDNMKWLLGGRYGTVEYSEGLKKLIGENFEDMADKISPYKYCYDALFIKLDGIDNTGKPQEERVSHMKEDSYIGYRTSSNAYPVKYELGEPGQKKEYKLRVKLKMPAYIKAINDAKNNDDVYLVSDDIKDPDGKEITPVIYLGKVKDLQYSFDIIEDTPGSENAESCSVDIDDTNIYASDVAQWCINYIKGHCTDDPVGKANAYSNRDQYWMERVYKKIDKNGQTAWKEFPGRPRRPTGYQEPVINIEDFDDITALSGHPVVNTYYDFVRKVSIRIYDPNIEDEDSRWLIPWVNPQLLTKDQSEKIEEIKEKQRKTLTLMKTNLRLVIIKN